MIGRDEKEVELYRGGASQFLPCVPSGGEITGPTHLTVDKATESQRLLKISACGSPLSDVVSINIYSAQSSAIDKKSFENP
ncbi:unnamed protein product, partial [Iphiclides podalirius]